MSYSTEEIRALRERYENARRCRERALEADEAIEQPLGFEDEVGAVPAKPPADRDTIADYIQAMTAAIERATDD